MLSLEAVTAGYGGEPVLRGVDACFPAGKVTAVIGKNGCGKSTLLRCVSRRLRYAGRISLGGRDVKTFDAKEYARLVSVLPQSRDVANISAEALVMHGRFPYLGFPRVPGKRDREVVEAAMEACGVWDYRGKNLAELSGGERQKVYFAMLMAQDAGTVLLDEPTTYLDMNRQYELLRLIRGLAQRGKTVVMVIHDVAQALAEADLVLLLEGGRAAAFGTGEQVYLSGEIDRVFGVRSESALRDGKAVYRFFERDE